MKPIPISRIKRFRAAIFDLDGVIVDSEKPHFDTFSQVFAEFGIRLSNAYWKRHCTGVGAPGVIGTVFKGNGVTANVAEWVGKRDRAYLEYVRRNGLKTIPGAVRFIRFLTKNRIKTAIASGSSRKIISASLRSVGLRGMQYSGIGEVRRRKPAPDLFLLAAKKLRVKPSECIVFEDAPAGFEAAARAGMACVALTTTNSKKSVKGCAALAVRDFNSPALRKLALRLLSRR